MPALENARRGLYARGPASASSVPAYRGARFAGDGNVARIKQRAAVEAHEKQHDRFLCRRPKTKDRGSLKRPRRQPARRPKTAARDPMPPGASLSMLRPSDAINSAV